MCPGLSSMVENIFHSFSSNLILAPSSPVDPWMQEYDRGACLEPYYIPLPVEYLAACGHDWSLMAEGVFLEFDVMLLGLCSATDHAVIFNPTALEMSSFKISSKFYFKYNVAIILTDDRGIASNIATMLRDSTCIERIINKLVVAEEQFRVRAKETKGRYKKVGVDGGRNLLFKEITRVAKIRNDLKGAAETCKDPDEAKPDDHIGAVVGTLLHAAEDASTEMDEDARFKGFVESNSSKSSAAEMAKALKKRAETMRNSFRQLSSVSLDIGGKSSKDTAKGNEHTVDTMSKGTKKAKKAGKGSDNEDSDGDDEEEDSATPPPFLSGTHSGPKSTHQPVFNTSSAVMKRRSGVRDTSYNDPAPGPGITRGISDMSRQMSFVRELVAQDEDFQEDLRLIADEEGLDYGNESCVLVHASELKSHIIVFGCMKNITTFVAECRKPLMVQDAYHSILIINREEPESWLDISDLYNDVYFIEGDMSDSAVFNRTNIKEAFALVLLADRSKVSTVEEESLDTEALLSYLKLEKYVPRHVFFTVELTVPSNIVVLNSTIMRRAKGTENYGIVRLRSDTDITKSGRRGSVASERSLQLTSRSNSANDKMFAQQKQSQLRGTFLTQRKTMAHADSNQMNHRMISRGSNSNSRTDLLKPKPKGKGKGQGKGKKEGVQIKSWLNFWSTGGGAKVSPRFDKKSSRQPLPSHSVSSGSANQRHMRGISGGKGSAGRGNSRSRQVNESSFWTIKDLHHELPVFASGRAFVPSAFDSIVCQVPIVFSYLYPFYSSS